MAESMSGIKGRGSQASAVAQRSNLIKKPLAFSFELSVFDTSRGEIMQKPSLCACCHSVDTKAGTYVDMSYGTECETGISF